MLIIRHGMLLTDQQLFWRYLLDVICQGKCHYDYGC